MDKNEDFTGVGQNVSTNKDNNNVDEKIEKYEIFYFKFLKMNEIRKNTFYFFIFNIVKHQEKVFFIWIEISLLKDIKSENLYFNNLKSAWEKW